MLVATLPAPRRPQGGLAAKSRGTHAFPSMRKPSPAFCGEGQLASPGRLHRQTCRGSRQRGTGYLLPPPSTAGVPRGWSGDRLPALCCSQQSHVRSELPAWAAVPG